MAPLRKLKIAFWLHWIDVSCFLGCWIPMEFCLGLASYWCGELIMSSLTWPRMNIGRFEGVLGSWNCWNLSLHLVCVVVGSYDNPQLGKWPTIRVTITRSENMSFQLSRLTETLAGIRFKKTKSVTSRTQIEGWAPRGKNHPRTGWWLVNLTRHMCQRRKAHHAGGGWPVVGDNVRLSQSYTHPPIPHLWT